MNIVGVTVPYSKREVRTAEARKSITRKSKDDCGVRQSLHYCVSLVNRAIETRVRGEPTVGGTGTKL
jgi:hypothetical protein